MSNIVLDREQLAWAAGFYDGEGSLSCIWQLNANGKYYRYLRMQLDQIEPTTLQRFQKALGGGVIYGPYAPRIAHHSPHWHWSLTSFEQVQHATCLLWSWLSEPKKAQAKLAFRRFYQAKYTFQRSNRKPGPKGKTL
jgi:hypothetical protein